MCQEAFAPLVSIYEYGKFEDAVAMVEDSPYGLQAGVYTNDIKKAMYAVRPDQRRRRHDQRHLDLPRGPHALRREQALAASGARASASPARR